MTTPDVRSAAPTIASAPPLPSVDAHLGVWAIYYADILGLPVFPIHGIVKESCACGKRECADPGKHPLTEHGLSQATTDIDQIRAWWKRTPNANIGGRMGAASGWVAVDRDPRKGGDESLRSLTAKYSPLPNSRQSLTGGGGIHDFLQHPGAGILLPSTNSHIAPGLDIKADGGYVVLPPSTHVSGARYLWEMSSSPDLLDLAPLPPWLIGLILQKSAKNGAASAEEERAAPDPSRAIYWLDRAVQQVTAGTRHDMGLWLACQLRDDTVAIDNAENIIATYVRAVPDHPDPRNRYTLQEALKTLNSVYATTARRPAFKKKVDLPEINADDGNLPRVTAAAWSALEKANNPPRLFLFAGVPARIALDGESGMPMTQPLDEDKLRHAVARAARFHRVKMDKKSGEITRPDAFPPLGVVRDMLADPTIPLPPLRRVVEHPAFTKSGTLTEKTGYDPAGQIYFAPPHGFTLPPVPDHPDQEEIARARSLILDDLLGDFPFTTKADKAHAVCYFLQPFARDLIDGPTPLYDFEKPVAGTGATLLAVTLASVAVGRIVDCTTAPEDDDELRKKLTTLYRGGFSHIIIDNVRSVVDWANLASALTNRGGWIDRELGRNVSIRVPVRATHAITANNPAFSGEMSRRIVRVRLDAKVDDPSQRSGFRHPRLSQWAMDNRGPLIHCALVLVRAWLDAGRPLPSKERVMGMFEEWVLVMGGILDVAHIEGFLENRRETNDESNSELRTWRTFVSTWWTTHRNNPVGTGELLKLVQAIEAFELEGDDQAQKIKLGKRLHSAKDRIFTLSLDDDGENTFLLQVTTAGKLYGGVRWCLKTPDGPNSGAF